MSTTDPPVPPVEPPAPPAPPTDPPLDPAADPPGDGPDLAALIDRLSQFDPAVLEQRLADLDARISGSEPVQAIRDALGPLFDSLDATLKDLVERLRTLPGVTPGPAPAPAPPKPPKPPAAAQGGGGVLDRLFSTPHVDAQ